MRKPPEVPRPDFGGGAIVYNVIDSRQSYPQEIVRKGVAAVVPELGEEQWCISLTDGRAVARGLRTTRH